MSFRLLSVVQSFFAVVFCLFSCAVSLAKTNAGSGPPPTIIVFSDPVEVVAVCGNVELEVTCKLVGNT